jgi:DNA-binding NtrC family response regulator
MKKIMILDDDVEILELLDRILNKHFEVITMTDPSKLKEGLHNNTPDLIIVDHFVGFETSHEIIDDVKSQEAFKNIPVIIHSGHEQIEQIAKSVKAAGFIRKPSGINEIRAYINLQINKEASVK